MIITIRCPEDMPGVIEQLRAIRALQAATPFNPGAKRQSRWMRTVWANSRYL